MALLSEGAAGICCVCPQTSLLYRVELHICKVVEMLATGGQVWMYAPFPGSDNPYARRPKRQAELVPRTQGHVCG